MTSEKIVFNVDFNGGRRRTYDDLLRELGLNPETVVVFNEGDPAPFDDNIQKEEIVIIRVISSG
ncbi:MAG: MoaD/ThiS family protein [Methanotrichaceae archaeon]|nr:MoaD/ThiS family protein [Methanotrichaceae archaeon]